MDVREARIANLKRLIEQAGSQKSLAEKSDLSPAHVSQMLHSHRPMGDEVARRIEAKHGLPFGSMDHPPNTLESLLAPDELELLRNYRAASPRWRLSLRWMSQLRADTHQDEIAESVNILLSKISAEPVPDERLGDKWTRPDRPPPSSRR